MLDHVSITVSGLPVAKTQAGNGLLRNFEPLSP
jgi:hypothetical protein